MLYELRIVVYQWNLQFERLGPMVGESKSALQLPVVVTKLQEKELVLTAPHESTNATEDSRYLHTARRAWCTVFGGWLVQFAAIGVVRT